MDEQKQMRLFYEIFDADLPRLGPGDDASTRKALDTVLSAASEGNSPIGSTGLAILDLGCGNGAQTIQLARHIDGEILAVDNHQPFLDELRRRAEAEGVSPKIKTRLGDMTDLGLEEGSFDLVWSEGAIYIMGFSQGLEACHRLLVPGGSVALTDISWLRNDVPDECRRFFADEYPAMADQDTNLAAIRTCGYDVIGHFTLPESAWWEPYYNPLEKRLPVFREKYAADREKLEVIEWIQSEIDLYRKYSSYYGYEFYLMRR